MVITVLKLTLNFWEKKNVYFDSETTTKQNCSMEYLLARILLTCLCAILIIKKIKKDLQAI